MPMAEFDDQGFEAPAAELESIDSVIGGDRGEDSRPRRSRRPRRRD